MRDSNPVRWWPAVVVLVLAAIAYGVVWFGPADSRQDRIMRTILIVVVATGLWLAWLVMLSRLRWRTRLVWVALVVLAGFVATRAVHIRGVSGDVMPILEWSWTEAEVLPGVEAAGVARAPAEVGPDDYPQFLGPDRTGILPTRSFAIDGDVGPATVVWKQPIGAGWSAFAVVGDLAVTQEQRGDDEWVTCYDVETGALRWKHLIGDGWDDPLGGPGPRATPTIADGRVYAFGGRGILVVLDLGTGERAWSVDAAADNGAAPPEYGYAGSPLVLDDAVVIAVGGTGGRSLVAYRREDGERLWSGGDRGVGYSSPTVASIAGVSQVLVFDADGLTSHAVDDGSELWHAPWHGDTQHTSQPVALPGDRVFQSSGYGVGGTLFQVSRGPDGAWSVEPRWASRDLKAKFTNVVHRDGFLYGLDDGILACIDVETGRRRWKGGRYGHGQVILADDVLVVQSEQGFVAFVEADPERFRELTRIDAIEGKTWNHPALSGRRLLVRNDREAARIDLPPLR